MNIHKYLMALVMVLCLVTSAFSQSKKNYEEDESEYGSMALPGYISAKVSFFFGGVQSKSNIKSLNIDAKATDYYLPEIDIEVGIVDRLSLEIATGYEKVVRVMSSLNKAGAWLGTQASVHALTDVTGFGLGGHALEMARGASVSMILDVNKVPIMEEAWTLATEGIVPGSAYRNLSAFGDALQFTGNLSPDHQLIFTDPQTSGGLLMAVAADAADEIVAKLKELNCLVAEKIGRVVAAEGASAVMIEGP